MTIILETPERPTVRSFAGGEAALSEIWEAAREQGLFVENSNAAFEALSAAYDERIAELHAATGVKLENPLLAAVEERRRREIERPFLPGLSASSLAGGRAAPKEAAEIYAEKRAAFERQLNEAAQKIPDTMEGDRLMRSIEGRAAEIAREADERLGRLFSSREGIGKWAMLLTGGMAGALNDPVTIASLAAGGGPGAARTVAGRILAVAGREALINAGTEAAVQPVVQAWRERVGLPAGFDEAARNVGFAALFGGLFGAGGQAAGELFSRAFGRTRAARMLEEAAAAPDATPALRGIVQGDARAAAESLSEIRAALAPEARGALDATARIARADAERPATASAEAHDLAVAAADRAIRDEAADAWPGFAPDGEQVERIARSIVANTLPAGADAAPAMELARFLAARGGVRDVTGELKQMAADTVAFRGRGRLVSRTGVPPDMAREAAAEAGFFDHLYGSPEEAVAKSTINDLYEALDAEIRQASAAGPTGREAALASVEGTVDEIARLGGPALPDALLEAAARLSIEERLDPADALERVLTRAELAGEPAAPARGGRAADPLPGWSDEELLAASQHRGPPPEPDPAAAEPGRAAVEGEADEFAAELAEADPAMMIPTGDGEASVKEIGEAIRRQRGLAALVEACHV